MDHDLDIAAGLRKTGTGAAEIAAVPTNWRGEARIIILNPDGSGRGLQTLLDGFDEPSLVVTASVVVMSNAPARAALGDSIDGRDVRLVIRHPAAIERLIGNNGVEDVELVGVGQADRRWQMRVVPLADGSKFVRLIDRSATHAAEQMRVDFVANASHELRTPLATIVGYAETLREADDGIDEATRARFAAIIHDEARRMQRVVEDLISLSRIESERFSPPSERLPLTPLVELAVEGHKRIAEERGSVLRLDAEPGLPLVAGDRSQLFQVFENIVANALRYGRAGTPVTIELRQEGRFVRVSVADQGEGIPAELIPRLTERFFRVDTGRSRALGGTGLGLAIVKHIVERHRGRLEIESQSGVGTTVSVLLPAEFES
ncbi:MAG: ATP-binding protein [Pseudomonadota bacterium]|nr:ATP-binding protein [Pseudomonadota bacterium]